MPLLVRLRISKKYNNPRASSPTIIPPIIDQGTVATPIVGVGVGAGVSGAAGVAVIPNVPVTPSKVAVICAVPVPTPGTRSDGLTIATVLSELPQATLKLKSALLPLEFAAIAVSCCESLASNESLPPISTIDTTLGVGVGVTSVVGVRSIGVDIGVGIGGGT